MVFAVIAIVKIASADDQAIWLWGCITLALCILSVIVMPNLPFVRVGIAFVLAFIGMIVYKVAADR